MAEYRQRIKVPANRLIRVKLQFDDPDNARVFFPEEKLEIEDFTLIGMEVQVPVPEQIPIGKKTIVHITDEKGGGAGTSNQKSIHVESKNLAASDTLFVLSTSSPDMSALQALPQLAEKERRFDVYAGCGFGMFQNILLAAGVTVAQLVQGFLAWGFTVDKIRMLEKRNRFDPVIKFCNRLIDGFDQLTVKDLDADIFIPVVNAVTGNPEVICKQNKPDFPLIAAVQCSLANLLDYVPVAIVGDGSPAGTAFADDGLLWSYHTFGLSCPDAALYNFFKPQKLNFTPFVSLPMIEKRDKKELKSHKELAAHYQVDEIGKRLKTEETVSIMRDLVPNYQPIYLDSLPTMHYAHRSQLEQLLSGVA